MVASPSASSKGTGPSVLRKRNNKKTSNSSKTPAVSSKGKEENDDEVLEKAKESTKTTASSGASQIPLWIIVLTSGCATALVLFLGIRLLSQIEQTEDPHRPIALYQEYLSQVADVPIHSDEKKRLEILDAIKDSYSSYERDAFGFDNYHPVSQTGTNLAKEPIGYFLIDSLDTLLMANMTDEYERAAKYVKELSFDVDDKFHTFETTIRVLGGLLSAYNIRPQDSFLLEKAVDLADRLLGAFETTSGLPLSFINLHSRQGIPDTDNYNFASVAEVGSLQLEFKYLSQLTGNPIYWEKVTRVMDIVRQNKFTKGLVPLFMEPQRGVFIPSGIRLGSRADSYYEYLLKQYLQTNRTEPIYKEMWDETVDGITSHLLAHSTKEKLTYSREMYPVRGRTPDEGIKWRMELKQDHLVCFLGGLWMLGASEKNMSVPLDLVHYPPFEENEFLNGMSLIKTCYMTYEHSKTGLGPEIVYFHAKTPSNSKYDLYIKRDGGGVNTPIDARNILRPETVESLFYAYRLTGDPVYREWAWNIFEAFKRWCKVPTGGYASITDVDQIPPEFEDRMETFWISETLKYLFLIFSDSDVFPLDKNVFNTEAHPLPVFEPTFY